jgi:hypothetical protein
MSRMRACPCGCLLTTVRTWPTVPVAIIDNKMIDTIKVFRFGSSWETRSRVMGPSAMQRRVGIDFKVLADPLCAGPLIIPLEAVGRPYFPDPKRVIQSNLC